MLALLLFTPARAGAPAAPASWGECPYAVEDRPVPSMYCNTEAFEATIPRPPVGTCDEISGKRVLAHTQFAASHYGAFMEAAERFPLAPLFDLGPRLVGDELYEQLLHLHIETMKQPQAAEVEDKILLKKTAADAQVPTTDMYFGAHLGAFDRGEFRAALEATCARGLDALFIKATHVAWSMGQKIVRDWQQTCVEIAAGNGTRVEALADYVVNEVLTLRNTDADSAHLAEALKPGVIVEEVFQTGGRSRRPLEAKALFVWGELYEVFMVGEDWRGCSCVNGGWKVYGDGNGWNLHGMLHEQDDVMSTMFMEQWLPEIRTLGSRMATGIGADLTRVDFFLGQDESGPVVKLNELETVSGAWYEHERRELGDIWRDGYIMAGRLHVTPEKWAERMADTEGDRDRYIFHRSHGYDPVVV